MSAGMRCDERGGYYKTGGYYGTGDMMIHKRWILQDGWSMKQVVITRQMRKVDLQRYFGILATLH